MTAANVIVKSSMTHLTTASLSDGNSSRNCSHKSRNIYALKHINILSIHCLAQVSNFEGCGHARYPRWWEELCTQPEWKKAKSNANTQSNLENQLNSNWFRKTIWSNLNYLNWTTHWSHLASDSYHNSEEMISALVTRYNRLIRTNLEALGLTCSSNQESIESQFYLESNQPFAEKLQIKYSCSHIPSTRHLFTDTVFSPTGNLQLTTWCCL